MGYKRCCVPDCNNNSHVRGKSFFKVSTKYRAAWRSIIPPGSSINLPESSYVCEDHFEENDFLNASNKSQGLHKYAVPKIHFPASEQCCFMDIDYEEPSCANGLSTVMDGNLLDVAGETEIDSAKIDVNVSNTPVMKRVNIAVDHDHDYLNNPIRSVMIAEKMIEMEERERMLKRDLRRKSQALHKKDVLIKQLRSNLADLKKRYKQDKKQELVDPILLELQANKLRKCRGARYSDAMKHLALVLHYCSVKAYKQMRQIFALPSISTLRKWLANIDVGEGFAENIFKLLKIKASFLPEEEKLVTIFFDEMAITEKLTYCGNAIPDYFKGFQTKLPGESEVDTNVRAKSALVLMLKSIRCGFKQSIGYFFCKDLKSGELKTIIDEAIRLVTASGLIPKVLVCDQNSINRALFTKEYKISEEKPYFEVLVGTNMNRIYCMYDAPHLYKSTRNNLLKHNAVYDGGVCSFNDVVDLYWEDVKHTPRTVPGLSYDHIKLAQFAEMNVGLAAQTLSRSVAVGLRAYVRTNKLRKGAIFTATYCEDFDELFDAANSSNFNTTKAMKRPLQATSVHWEMFEAMTTRLKSLRFIDKNCFDIDKEQEFKRLVKQSRSPYFIEGWLLYISSLKLIWKELHTAYGFKFLRTRNLSQDCLEHFFSQVRWKNGNNNHPDASLFSAAYKALVVNHLILPEKIGNVQADLSKYLINRQELSKVQMVKQKHVRTEYVDGEPRHDVTPDEPVDANQLANIYWTTGWVCSKLRHKECIQRVAADNEDVIEDVTFLADMKKYTKSSNIFEPGVKILQYFTGVCKLFDEHFMPLLRRDPVGVKEELMDIVETSFGFPSIQHFNAPNESILAEEVDNLILDVLCESCALRVTNKYLNMLISCRLGQLNNAFKEKDQSKRKSKKHEKARKLNIVTFSALLTPKSFESADEHAPKKKAQTPISKATKASTRKARGRPKQAKRQ